MYERTGRTPPGRADAVRSVDAVVLAGGPPAPELTGSMLPKAFAEVGAATMAEHVLAALSAVPRIHRIVLVAPAPVPPRAASAATAVVGAEGGVLDNVSAGLAVAGDDGDGFILIAAADVPLLSPAAVNDFLDAAQTAETDAAYAIVPSEDVYRVAPGIRKTFVRVADGTFTGGSLVLLRRGAFDRARPLIERAVRARKRPWELARLFGLAALVGFATGRLTIAALERRAEALGIRARAVVCRDAGVALDVDTVEMLAFVRARAARAEAGHAPHASGPAPPPSDLTPAPRQSGEAV